MLKGSGGTCRILNDFSRFDSLEVPQMEGKMLFNIQQIVIPREGQARASHDTDK